jgi:hypothetical protein
VVLQDPADRRGADTVAELEQLAADSLVAPARVLPRHPHDQGGEGVIDRWPPGPVGDRSIVGGRGGDATPVGFQKSAWACDLHGPAARHDRDRVATPALPDLQPAAWLADAPRPHIVDQRHRTARSTPRGGRTPQNQPEAPPGLGRPSIVRRADPTPPGGFAQASPDHPRHGLAVAPPPRDQHGPIRTAPVAHPSTRPSPS